MKPVASAALSAAPPIPDTSLPKPSTSEPTPPTAEPSSPVSGPTAAAMAAVWMTARCSSVDMSAKRWAPSSTALKSGSAASSAASRASAMGAPMSSMTATTRFLSTSNFDARLSLRLPTSSASAVFSA